MFCPNTTVVFVVLWKCHFNMFQAVLEDVVIFDEENKFCFVGANFIFSIAAYEET